MAVEFKLKTQWLSAGKPAEHVTEYSGQETWQLWFGDHEEGVKVKQATQPPSFGRPMKTSWTSHQLPEQLFTEHAQDEDVDNWRERHFDTTRDKMNGIPPDFE